jgi:hypothetical protein
LVQVYWLPGGPGPGTAGGLYRDPRAFRLWNEAASDWEAPSGGTFLIAEVSATSASRFPVPERGCRGSLADACLSRFQR